MRSLTVIFVSLLLALGSFSAFGQQEPKAGKPVTIPTRYIEDRFYAVPVTTDNVTLLLFTDSAGSLNIYNDVVEKLGLKTELLKGASDNGSDLTLAPLPTFKPDAAIPTPLGSRHEGRLFVLPRKESALLKRDGMLGQQWFAGRVWTFDYPAKTLLWRVAGDIPKHDKAHEVQLFFRLNSAGERANNFARIPIEVDGETIDFVLDTGATNVLSDEALKLINDGKPAERATSFLVYSVYQKWHMAHPEWRVLENIKALTGNFMIEVPTVTIGGYKVGPVWFTVQPDFGFQAVMGSITDKRVSGALGGSALHYFRMTVDWPNGLAVFEK
ncbi:MAG TPA: hypothetical protein VI306_13680 [Pyrinomonadaceae bacterium]